MSWGIIASSVTGGAIAAAVGALIGATAARYHRDQQWLRDRRADGCAALLAEHTRIELELRTAHAHQRRPAAHRLRRGSEPGSGGGGRVRRGDRLGPASAGKFRAGRSAGSTGAARWPARCGGCGFRLFSH
jgi:hypothetical protein